MTTTGSEETAWPGRTTASIESLAFHRKGVLVSAHPGAARLQRAVSVPLLVLLLASVAILLLLGCGRTIEAQVKSIDSNVQVTNSGMTETGVATVVLPDGSEAKVQMDAKAMEEFNASKSGTMKLRTGSSGQYEYSGMAK